LGDREGWRRFHWPHGWADRSCRERMLLSDDEGHGVIRARYRRVSVAAATHPTHVELEGSQGELSGTDDRGHGWGAWCSAPACVDGVLRAAAGPSVATGRQSVGIKGADQRKPQLLRSVVDLARWSCRLCGLPSGQA